MNEKDKLLKEGLAAFKKANYNGIALLPTGVGKGKLMIEIAKLLNPPDITYLCNTQLLRDKMFKDELYKWDAAYLLDRMELQCYQTARKWVNRRSSLLLADEFDAALTPEYIKAITNNVYDHKILVSATLDDAKRRKALKIAPIIFERNLIEVIEKDVLNNINFYIVNYDLTPIENGKYLSYNSRFRILLNDYRSHTVENQLQWLQIQRKQFMQRLGSSAEVTKWLLANLRPKNEKVLVFCGLSEQADKVCKYSFHSNNGNIQVFNDFEAGIIKEAAVVDKVDRGLNIDQIRHIIFESLGSSKTRLTQRIGRGMRLEAHEFLNVYIPVPYFTDNWGHRKPTIVQNWLIDATKDMDLSRAKTINYKKSGI